MHNEHNIYQYEYFKEIDSICTTLCTDEPEYIDVDSHYIHIPKQLFIELTNNININMMCFEITTQEEPYNKIFIKKIEPSDNNFENYIWLPNWICDKLNIGVFGRKIQFVPVANPKKIKKIKIQGNNSSYISKDIKTLLELKIEQFKCINLGEKFHIDDVIFEVKELIGYSDTNPDSDELIRFGIITNEIIIDFEKPLDIQFLEKRKYIMDIITFEINKKIDEIFDSDSDKNKSKFKRKVGIFNFSEYMENEKKLAELEEKELHYKLTYKVDIDLISNIIIEKINLNDSFQNVPNPSNIKLTNDDIDLVKEIIELGKNLMAQMDNEAKLKKKNSNQNIDPESKSETDSELNHDEKPKYFNTTPYTLGSSDTNSSKDSNSNNKLSQEEIRNLRMKKFNNSNIEQNLQKKP